MCKRDMQRSLGLHEDLGAALLGFCGRREMCFFWGEKGGEKERGCGNVDFISTYKPLRPFFLPVGK